MDLLDSKIDAVVSTVWGTNGENNDVADGGNKSGSSDIKSNDSVGSADDRVAVGSNVTDVCVQPLQNKHAEDVVAIA